MGHSGEYAEVRERAITKRNGGRAHGPERTDLSTETKKVKGARSVPGGG